MSELDAPEPTFDIQDHVEIKDPVVEIADVQEVARDLLMVPNRGIQLVPNIGVIGGSDAVLVVETGMGPANATKVLTFAEDYAKGRRMYLTTTHFHPEHAFGAQVFTGHAQYLANRTQAEDLQTKAVGYVQMFRGLSPLVARQLVGVEVRSPDVVYDESYDLDLGGRVVHLQAVGQAHTKGDQVITVLDAGVMFTGDLVETGQFAIFPWFPPYDADVSGLRWIRVMERLIGEHPHVVVPGHGVIGGPERLADIRQYLEELRDETWRRRDSAMDEHSIVEEVRTSLLERHPDWKGQEWIEPGVHCLFAEHAT